MSITTLPKTGLNTQSRKDKNWDTALNDGLEAFEDRIGEEYDGGSGGGNPNGEVEGFWLGRTIFDTSLSTIWTCVELGTVLTTKWQMLGVPVGSIQAFPFSALPPGYLALDGTSYPKGDYPRLWDVLPAAGGAGVNDNPIWKDATLIHLPDFKDYILVGGSDPNKVGNRLGTDTALEAGGHEHTGDTAETVLTIDQIPPHTHDYFGYDQPSGGPPESQKIDNDIGQVLKVTNTTGGGLGHKHSITPELDHTHNLDPFRVKIIWAIRAF